MALDRIWTIVDGGPVWVEVRAQSPIAVAPITRSTTSGSVAYPEATTTIRIRYRNGISLLTRFIDHDHNIWHCNGYVEVGRLQWIDISVSTYGETVTGPDTPGNNDDTMTPAPSGFTPPAGWHLQDATGHPVQNLIVGAYAISNIHVNGLAFLIPADGYQLAAGETYADGDTFAVRTEGIERTLQVLSGTADRINDATVLANGGGLWPDIRSYENPVGWRLLPTHNEQTYPRVGSTVTVLETS